MPQIQLPIFPEEATHLSPELAVQKKDGRVVYFNGLVPVFTHDEKDVRTFRMITSQLCCHSNVKQSRIGQVFKVADVTVKRAVKLYRDKGPEGFYVQRRTRGPAVLTPEIVSTLQRELDKGGDYKVVAVELGLKPDTVRKAIQAGRLHIVKKRAQKRDLLLL